MPPPSYGYALFCDDFRPEMGGKFSLMGMYGQLMLVHEQFPVTLPKFCIFAVYCRPYEKERPHISSFEIRVWLPADLADAPSLVMAFPADAIETAQQQHVQQAAPEDPELQRVIHIAAPLVMQPLVIREAGVMKVRAFVDGEITKIGALRIQRAPQ